MRLTREQVLVSFLEAVEKLSDGGKFDLTDSPKSFISNVQRLAGDARKSMLSAAPASRDERVDSVEASTTTCEARGVRTVGPHGGLMQKMPNPTEADMQDPIFEAIWQATKTWDVNAPEYYVGYCGLNGSHVMLILNAIRAAAPSRPDAQQPPAPASGAAKGAE